MSVHKISLPQKVIVGKNAINQICHVCYELKLCNKTVILTGPNVNKIAGEKVYDILCNANIQSELFVVKDFSTYGVENISEKIRNLRDVSAIIGVGGGRVIDLTKLISFKTNVPYISVPTAASHDGIASPIVSMKSNNKKFSIIVNPPISIIADSEIIARAPYKLTASGCGDIIAKFTAVKDWKLANKRIGEYYGDYAASLALMSAKLVVKYASEIRHLTDDSIRTVIEALISCGVAMCIAGSSRPCSGAEHLFSHALEILAKKPALHGEQCGVGTIIMTYLHKGYWKRIKDTLSMVGAPTNAKELGVDEYEIIEAIVKAKDVRSDRYTILNEKEISWKKAEEIAIVTGVIGS
ncbi:MAG: NAD(P)-dependent glycerol-1-phosphate dehydrogenase [Candidatus Methanomethylicia archaeon]|nr:NAD(P)-dependent glycerol-1-phosphate dehydrogenase [Candidatus Methanomethylicia archaeon]MCX8169339.1 NAD(P)-dependent glycerol-1-phosphate dehydrogenase [Candidatus Methanomethylicia archaeon]MDW7988878.1 NAD(P)-dependent glycerol-1-phosphate dehydrogenase [Nitrososphaerota archaeon]